MLRMLSEVWREVSPKSVASMVKSIPTEYGRGEDVCIIATLLVSATGCEDIQDIDTHVYRKMMNKGIKGIYIEFVKQCVQVIVKKERYMYILPDAYTDCYKFHSSKLSVIFEWAWDKICTGVLAGDCIGVVESLQDVYNKDLLEIVRASVFGYEYLIKRILCDRELAKLDARKQIYWFDGYNEADTDKCAEFISMLNKYIGAGSGSNATSKLFMLSKDDLRILGQYVDIGSIQETVKAAINSFAKTYLPHNNMSIGALALMSIYYDSKREDWNHLVSEINLQSILTDFDNEVLDDSIDTVKFYRGIASVMDRFVKNQRPDVSWLTLRGQVVLYICMKHN